MFLKGTFVNIVKIAGELKSLEDRKHFCNYFDFLGTCLSTKKSTKSTNQPSKCEDALGFVCFHLVITDNKMLLVLDILPDKTSNFLVFMEILVFIKYNLTLNMKPS